MQRIMIVGNGGAGKTVLANRLGRLLAIPVTHLDALRYDSSWNIVPEERFAAAQREIITEPSWIIDGNSLHSLPLRLAAADTVIIVDPPPWVCLRGILQRRRRYGGGQHPDGVHDRITPEVLWYVARRYRHDILPRVQACIAEHFRGTRLVHLTSRSQTDHYLDQVTRHHGINQSGADSPALTDKGDDVD